MCGWMMARDVTGCSIPPTLPPPHTHSLGLAAQPWNKIEHVAGRVVHLLFLWLCLWNHVLDDV